MQLVLALTHNIILLCCPIIFIIFFSESILYWLFSRFAYFFNLLSGLNLYDFQACILGLFSQDYTFYPIHHLIHLVYHLDWNWHFLFSHYVLLVHILPFFSLRFHTFIMLSNVPLASRFLSWLKSTLLIQLV